MMQEKLIGPGGKTAVGGMFQKSRIFCVLADLGTSGKGFGGNDLLSVYPCCFGDRIPDSPFAACPELAHRDVGDSY